MGRFRKGLASSVVALELLLWLPRISAAAPGDVDPGFGIDGRADVATPVDTFWPRDVDVATDGSITIVGDFGDPATSDRWPALVRLTPDGSLDTSFGQDGVWIGSRSGSAPRAAIRGDGSAIVASRTRVELPGGARPAIRVFALDPTGALDVSFSRDGVATISVPREEPGCLGNVGDIAIAADGRIVVPVGGCGNFSPVARFGGMIRLLPDGTRDRSFGGDGAVFFRMAIAKECCYITAIQALTDEDGSLSWVGMAQHARDGYESWQQIATIVRVDGRGRLVAGYGVGGVARLTGWDVAGEPAGASLLDSGAIVLAGRGGPGWDQYYGHRMVMKMGADGRPARAFSDDGVWTGATLASYGEIPIGTWVDGSGRITSAWTTSDFPSADGGYRLCRLLTVGRLDRTYASNGCRRGPVPMTVLRLGIEPSPGRRLVLAGYAGGQPYEPPTAIVAMRFLTR